jgi:hypothetical protein
MRNRIKRDRSVNVQKARELGCSLWKQKLKQGVTGNSERATMTHVRYVSYSSRGEKSKGPLILEGFDRAFDWISKRVFPGKFEKQAGQFNSLRPRNCGVSLFIMRTKS